jgi:predicted permease
MLSNFLFSLSAALPIFIIMCIGYILKKKNILDDHFIRNANVMIFNVALPVKLFDDVYGTALSEFFDVKFIGFIFAGIILTVVVSWGVGVLCLKDRAQHGAFIQGSFRGNFLYVGYSIMENLTGSIGVKAPLAVAVTIPLYNILAILILSFTKNCSSEKPDIRRVLITIARNPLIWGIILGVGATLLGIKIPDLAIKSMNYLKVIATPLALLTIGASFKMDQAAKNLGPALLASVMKLFIFPLIAVVLGIMTGFGNEDLLIIYVLFGVPTATVSFIVTSAMKGDQELAANIVMLTTILSVVSITLFIFTFKTLGMI